MKRWPDSFPIYSSYEDCLLTDDAQGIKPIALRQDGLVLGVLAPNEEMLAPKNCCD
jgi:hypothetical protein